MINFGQPAPDFTLPDQGGRPITLSSLRGKPVVLYFYPKDNTPGCTKQACAIRDDYHRIRRRGAVVLGVSPDSTRSHEKFAATHKLPFTLLADSGHTVCKLYGVWKEKTLYGRKYFGVERTTFIIDDTGVVRQIERKVRVDGHSERVLRAIDELISPR